ncbi:haloalkane dehalogenase [Actinacidiphila acidipaludis]|uniref:Haloalkane dehalogenase n=1 Tax=Actinacidiphila acidipaludis TaxID=2873382 RepID=A0ABS7QF70_9ACTN|nr:haloalkane dehalogenase [Streptomyces acidipaludis]MBY8881787.1 haloalkane dehalogenase [Streptomyces acidipaludis]
MPTVDVLDSTLHYLDSGSGTPVVLLHGNPASSHVWRDVMPGLGGGRLLAPDLIGMGRSGKPALDYSFADHARYLDAWFDALGLDRVILVGHDWGGALAFDWARRHPDRVLGVAFLETVVKSVTWEELSPQARQRSRTVLGPEAEETLMGADTLVRMAFTGGGVLTPVGDEDLAAYLAPYPDRESRRPLLAWARQLPIGGEPPEVVARIEEYDAWLAASTEVPKLLMTFEGAGSLLIDERMTAWCREHIAALEIVHCGPAGHHAPEDRPAEIAAAVSAWADRHGLRDEVLRNAR